MGTENDKKEGAAFDLEAFDQQMGNGNMSDQETNGFEIADDNKEAMELAQVRHAEDDDAGDEGEGEGEGAGNGEGEGGEAEKAKAKEGEGGEGEGEGEGGELPEWVKARLAREKRKQARIEAENAQLRREKEELEKRSKEQQKAPKDPGPAPKASEFEDYEDYLEAKAAHKKAAQAFEKASENGGDDGEGEGGDDKDKGKKDGPPAELTGAIAEIDVLLKEDHPDLHKIMFDPANPKGLQISPDMIFAITEADNPAAVMQALADKPELSHEISKLPPAKQGARIAKLDKPTAPAKAAPGKDGAAAEPGKKVSTAPDPIDPVRGTATPARAYSEMSFTEFEERRKAEQQKSPDFW